MIKKYTVSDLRSKTREVLNEAVKAPVTITRYDEEFVLSKVYFKQKSDPEEPLNRKASV